MKIGKKDLITTFKIMEFKNFKGSVEKKSINSNKEWWENNPMTYDWEGNNQVSSKWTKDWFRKIEL